VILHLFNATSIAMLECMGILEWGAQLVATPAYLPCLDAFNSVLNQMPPLFGSSRTSHLMGMLWCVVL